MTHAYQILSERQRDIGGFSVGRLLPTAEVRTVGPFIFVDHMGPAIVGPHHFVDVDQHPHIGLATLTYLMQGEIFHKDSLGSEQRITPGAVNWMVAGRGVTHTERTPQELRSGQHVVHGYQFWVALPTHLEEMMPDFHHTDAADVPAWTSGGMDFRLIAGSGFGYTSPVPVQSELFLIELQTTDAATLDIKNELFGECGLCVVEGQVQIGTSLLNQGEMLIGPAQEIGSMTLSESTHLLVLGGTPFHEKRFIHWNFVSSHLNAIKAAVARWQANEFPKVPNDTTYVPIPRLVLRE
mgnify:CR=1 FL=1